MVEASYATEHTSGVRTEQFNTASDSIPIMETSLIGSDRVRYSYEQGARRRLHLLN